MRSWTRPARTSRCQRHLSWSPAARTRKSTPTRSPPTPRADRAMYACRHHTTRSAVSLHGGTALLMRVGTRLGPYEITATLGAGGMGEVYQARDARLERDVAIKVVASHATDAPHARERFEREARSVAGLQHPNICTIYDVGDVDGRAFIVMELLRGETLLQRLE